MPEQTNLETDFHNPTWSDDAPRGGKAVLNRIIKEKATHLASDQSGPCYNCSCDGFLNQIFKEGYRTAKSAASI